MNDPIFVVVNVPSLGKVEVCVDDIATALEERGKVIASKIEELTDQIVKVNIAVKALVQAKTYLIDAGYANQADTVTILLQNVNNKCVALYERLCDLRASPHKRAANVLSHSS